MMCDAKKKLGRNIPHKKVSSGRKAPDICVQKGMTVTDKEAEYLALYKSGKSFTEIAAEKGVGVSTVSKALSKFKEKKD